MVGLVIVNCTCFLVGCGGSSETLPDSVATSSSLVTPSPTETPLATPTRTAEPLPTVSLPPYIPVLLEEDIVESELVIRNFDSENIICSNNESTSNTFTEVALSSGINHIYESPESDGVFGQGGGVAAGDFNNDGWTDFYLVGGIESQSALYRNLGDGTFENVATAFGLDFMEQNSGPSFADFNGDGWLDLFIGAVGSLNGVERRGEIRLLTNSEGESFEDHTVSSGIQIFGNTVSASWGDYDKDGDLDLVTSHWIRGPQIEFSYLWRNDRQNGFVNVDDIANIPPQNNFATGDDTFTPNFTDINGDGWLDILMASDRGYSQVYLNKRDGSFENITNAIISDQSGMGAAVGDYDNDGDMDWFVTAISEFDGFGHPDGNRLYENRGDGYFSDKTDVAGVRDGFWGWGACFADFNNDGHLDIFHVNGMTSDTNTNFDWNRFVNDPSRLFISNGDKTFSESSLSWGIIDDGLGRGLSCLDYDKDGDMDILVTNNGERAQLYCNSGNGNSFLNVSLQYTGFNRLGIGSKILVTQAGITQMREISAGNNYVSQNPAEAHFGFHGSPSVIDMVKVLWSDGKTTVHENIEPNQHITIIR